MVYVPVSGKHLAEVYRYLAELGTEGPVTGNAEEEDSPLPGGTGGGLGDAPWTTAELSQLASGTTTTTRLITQVMDVLASRPGERYSTTDLVERLGVLRE